MKPAVFLDRDSVVESWIPDFIFEDLRGFTEMLKGECQ